MSWVLVIGRHYPSAHVENNLRAVLQETNHE